jgi:hypothetical protein
VHILRRPRTKFMGELSTWEKQKNAGLFIRLIANLTTEVIVEMEQFWVMTKWTHLCADSRHGRWPCDKLRHLGELGDLERLHNKVVGWKHFHHDIFVSGIANNNN